jgi:predicted transcriptional regulator
MEPSVQKLVALGFTVAEAETYIFLLKEGRATGYRIAQSLGKPLSNTYKAAESLQARGAVIVEEGEPRCYRAAPANELLNRMEREFLKIRAEAAQALAGIERATPDPGVYQLQTRAQVLERCYTMLEGCRQVALLDLFPEPLAELREVIERTAARGVLVGVVAYQPAALAGVEVVVDPAGPNVLQRWPGQWLNLVADGAECLMAFLASDGDGLFQAIWSGSAYLAWVVHSMQAWALAGPALERQILNGASLAQLQESAQFYRRFHALEAAGYQNLMRSLQSAASGAQQRRKAGPVAAAGKGAIANRRGRRRQSEGGPESGN